MKSALHTQCEATGLDPEEAYTTLPSLKVAGLEVRPFIHVPPCKNFRTAACSVLQGCHISWTR